MTGKNILSSFAVQIIAALLLTLPAGLSASESGPGHSARNDVIILKNWQVSFAKSEEKIDVVAKRTDWKPVAIPGMVSFPLSPQRPVAFMWLKGSFILDDPDRAGGSSRPAALHIGRIASGYIKAYINNVPVGKREWGSLMEYSAAIYFTIPDAVPLKRNNEVLVLIAFAHYNLSIPYDFAVLSAESHQKQLSFYRLMFKTLPIAYIILFLIAGVAGLSLYFAGKKGRDCLYLSLALMTQAVLLVLAFMPGNLYFSIYQYFAFILYKIFTVIDIILVFYFIQSIYGIYLAWYNRVFIGASVCLYLLFGASMDYGIVYPVLTNTANIVMFSLLVFLLARQKMNKQRLYIVLGMVLCLVILCTYKIVTTINNLLNTDLYLYMHMLYLVLFIVFDQIIVKREQRTVYRPLRAGEGAQHAAVTETMEQKLERVIAFLDKNYLSDISREGLAAAVSLHPDYMSRQFQKHTGKKINDYINQLRVEEVVRRLGAEGGNGKIIDMAFSVGFESLSTFNRAFKKIYGVNPRDFKSRNGQ